MRDTTPNPGIAIFLTGDFPEGKAANSRIKAIAKGLLTSAYSPELVFLWASAFNNSGINTETKGLWESIPFHYANNSCRRPPGLVAKIVDSIRGSLNAARWLLRNRKRLKLCYIYSGEISAFLPVYVAAKFSGIPILVERTELRSAYPYTGIRKVLRFLFRIDERLIPFFADHLLVISQNLYAHYSKWTRRDNISLVPVLTDTSRFVSEVKQQRGLIGYIGTFGDKDRVPEIMKAFKNAREHNKELRLRLIGYYGGMKEFEAMAAEMQIAPFVEFTGQVSYAKVPGLLKECDLLLMNRDASAYSSYGSAAKVGEYLAAGIPAIVTKVGDIEKYLKNGRDAILIPPGDNEALTSAILQRYERYDEFTQTGLNGRFACEKWFSIVSNMPAIATVVERLIHRSRKSVESRESRVNRISNHS